MYRQFNIQQFYVLPTQCIYVFCVDLRTNRDYFPIQHQLTGFYARSQNCEKRLFASNMCLSVRPSACMEQLGSRKKDFQEILCFIIFRKSVVKIKFH